jgi:hypothetical protein
LAIVHSLAYFLPVIDEVLELKISQDYFQHLRCRLERLPLIAFKTPTSR